MFKGYIILTILLYSFINTAYSSTKYENNDLPNATHAERISKTIKNRKSSSKNRSASQILDHAINLDGISEVKSIHKENGSIILSPSK